ncbi:MAG TPA: DUF4337 family protein [Thermoanaerobaculia bacterium]|jgi:hypothetical protein|nr:DUF4337 family protein [Thermoanaerobaculia bacterium]
MPESEIETENLQEAIHEELEKEGGNLLKRIALTTAIMAAFAAVAALRAGATVNEALVLKTEATQAQAQASDQWAYYQAKGIKAATLDSTAAAWSAAGKPVPPNLAASHKRYADEQAAITVAAREKEHERDERNAEAEHLLHQHHRFANAVAMLQVAIALGAVAALTRISLVWAGSALVGLAGIAFFVSALVA